MPSQRSSNALPITPQMGYVGLPPSPLSPSNGFAPNTPILRAPHMGTVSLPPSAPQTPLQAPYGLLTPPHSPPELRRVSNSVSPYIAYGTNQCRFDVRQHPQRFNLQPAVVQSAAFQFPANRVFVHIAGTEWTFPIENPRTVADVLGQVHAWISDYCSKDDSRGIPPHITHAASAAMAARGGSHLRRYDFLGNGLYFAGLTRATDGTDRWDLYLSV